jgi:hypothetical protein
VGKPIWSIIVINFQDHQTTEIFEESVLLKQGTIVEHYFAHSKVIHELTLSSALYPLLHPLPPLSSPLSVAFTKYGNFIKSL